MSFALSIIIVSFNVKDLLKDCLQSLGGDRFGHKFEIIVVDNNSSDGSCQMVRKDFPEVKLVESRQNLGFAKANNLGAKRAKGKYLFFLNPDTKICQGSLEKIVEFLETHPEVGIVGCRLLNADGSFQPSVGCFPSILTLLWEKPIDFLERRMKKIRTFLGLFCLKYRRFKKPVEVDWVSGAALACRKEVFEQLGGFDERFFMYFEDVDLCLRAREKGWKVWYLPECKIYHLRGKSQPAKSRKKAKVYYQNQDYFFQKHRGKFYSLLVKLVRWPYQFLELRTKVGRYY